jgi:hypothetical protein
MMCCLIGTPSAQELIWVRFLEDSFPAYVSVDSQGCILTLGFQIIVKYDPDGNVLWEVTDSGVFFAANAVDMEEHIVVALYAPAGVLKLTPDGEEKWRVYLSDLCWELRGIATDDEGNIYGVGHHWGSFVVKLSPEGELLWTREEPGWGYGIACAVDTNGDLVVATHEEENNSRDYDWKTIRFTSDGEKVWERIEGGEGIDWVTSICLDNDGNAYVGGERWLIKYGRGGDLIWFDPAGIEGTRSVAFDGQSNIYVGSYMYPSSPRITKCNLDGQVIWSITSEGAPDGAMVALATWTTDYLVEVANPQTDVYFATAKYYVGSESSNRIPVPRKQRLYVFPNPSGGLTTIQYPCLSTKQYTLRIFDLSGHLVYGLDRFKGETTWDFTGVDQQKVEPGAYVCILTDNSVRAAHAVVLRNQ